MEIDMTESSGRPQRYTKPVVVTVRPEQHAAALEFARVEGVSVAGLLRGLLVEHLRGHGFPDLPR